MNKTAYFFLPLLYFASLMAAPLKAQIPHLVFHVELGGSEVIPAVNTDAKGLITFIFTPDRKKVDVSGMIVKLDGTVTEATIRLGITGQTGAVLLDFLPLIDGRHIVGQMDAPPELLQNLLLNGVYAEIRTTVHPNGEMRGQFVCETDLDFGVHMTGSQANPPNNSPGRAFGAIHFPLGSRDIVYAFVVGGLSSAITKVELHEGPPGQIGTFVLNMPGFFGNIIQSIILLDTIDPNFLLKAREGKYYVVIKTVNFPNGELVGKVEFLGYFASLAPINGIQQLPPPSPPTPGFGFSHNKLNKTLDSLTTTLYIASIQPTAVKIHTGLPLEVGPVLVDMGIGSAPGFFTKKYKITETQLTDFAQGRLYINASTVAYPDGELRGVMKNTLRKAYAFDLCGVQMVPPTNSNALGIAVASVDQANCYLNYKVITDGLAGTPVDGYFAQGAFGTNGVAFHSMPNAEPIIAGSHEIMASLGPIIENGGTYVQISTPGNIGGEIRGQVRRAFTCPEVVAVTELDNIGKVIVSPVPFQDVLNVELESMSAFDGRLVLRDILGVLGISQSVQIVAGEQTLQMETGNLPKGFYTLYLESPSQNTAILLKKVVKVD
ncbi:MAG: CHRD domain-containing protein [Saprospiraceae bacterium]|nr:CHRD domain-containing protein [Saprospiraceae bacterium]